MFRRKKMNRTELIDAIAKKMDNSVTKKDLEATLKSFVEVVTEELAKKEKIQLVGFGTFETSVRPAREGRNPRTGETMKIAESVVPKFKPGKALKDAVNK
ncbi:MULTISPECIES: HU family DNA-binding protein [Lachnoanaerobaculum]|nr:MULTISPECIES: HU family DNA-binding protein [Lachnoanaerobaculum]MDU6631357.1 HU family DNA-binding protein [Lachnoanaerobaculum sp.]WHE88787.1 HU family DNA-binding protein [Lachnoanaerobaculum gingivalis]